jgi:hypothetical protein
MNRASAFRLVSVVRTNLKSALGLDLQASALP